MQKRQITALVVFALVLALGVMSAHAAGKTVTIRVDGMYCGGCSSSIEKKLKATDGVQEVRVSYEKKEAWIKFNDQKVSEAKAATRPARAAARAARAAREKSCVGRSAVLKTRCGDRPQRSATAFHIKNHHPKWLRFVRAHEPCVHAATHLISNVSDAHFDS